MTALTGIGAAPAAADFPPEVAHDANSRANDDARSARATRRTG
jgi:hypothetical protein